MRNLCISLKIYLSQMFTLVLRDGYMLINIVSTEGWEVKRVRADF